VTTAWQPGLFQAAVSVLYYSRGVTDPTVNLPRLLDRLVGDRVNTVSLVFPIYTASVTASSVNNGADTPDANAISYFAAEAHKRGLSVMLRPELDEGNFTGSDWRGTLRPGSAPAWFHSYQSLIVSYGQLAESNRVEMLDVGTEFTSMEAYPNSWVAVIAAVRAVYHGQVTYSANWQGSKPTFWNAVDFISYDAYWPLNAANPTVGEMAAAWKPALDQVRSWTAPYGKPVVFTELGVVARSGAYQRPWVQKSGTPLDQAQQATYYAAACQATRGVVRGLYWWEVDVAPLPDPVHDPGYNPLGKPAEDAMRSCYSTTS
jgi:hypothetical protein